METSRPQPTEAEWLQRKPALRKLYLVDEVSLKRLVADADKMGLVVTVAQMEYKLKLWGFRRNIDKATWISIDNRISKRKAMGKESEVIHCGKRLKPSTIEKATNRYRDMSIFAQHAPVITKHDGNVGSIRLLQSVKTQAILPMVLGVAPGLTLTESQPQVSQLAAMIGLSMPESFPGENLQRAQILVNGSSEECLLECWTILFYNLSNNLVDLCETVQWSVLLDLLREYGVLNLKIDSQSLQDATVQGFMHTIFHASIYHVLHYQALDSGRSEALEAVTWLLSSGHNPDNWLMIPHLNYHTVTPLQAAILCGSLDLMEQLLKAGADANLVLDHGSGGSASKPPVNMGRSDIAGAIVPHPPLELSLGMYRHGSEMAVRMARLLLKHGASKGLDQALQLVISRGETQIAMEIVQEGANPTTALQNPCGFLYEETSISAAASAGLSEMKFIIDLLRSKYPEKSTADFLSADVFISAAAEGKDDTSRYLYYSINPNGIASNCYGVTPLHAAARKGRLETCQLLMNLQGYYPYTSTHPSPLHLASYGGHTQIVQLFLNRGADVDDIVTLQSPQERQRFLERYDLHGVDFCTPCHLTPLQLLLTRDRKATLRASTTKQVSCATTLVKAGAKLTGFEVLSAVEHLRLDLLTAALAAGGDPNCLFRNGLRQFNALQLLFTDNIKARSARALRKAQIVDILLKHDAKLLGGEVTLAICSGDQNLVDLLLGSGGSLKVSTIDGVKCLEAAILLKDPKTITRVIEDDSAKYDGGALCAAVQTGMQDITKWLLQLRPEQAKTTIYDITALGLAAQLGDVGLFQTLLTLFTFSNVAKLPFFVASDGVLTPVSRAEAGDNYNQAWWCLGVCVEGSPLALAVMSRDIEIVGELLQRGFEPDLATWTICADLNDLAMLQTLFDQGKWLDNCEPVRNALVRSRIY
ncbi:unnamed protein product [Clonostachys rhizophaga]|uniref:Clr5 domain-containing protein n=1 Tax=Clonostachys rhizophaga TaxID=160324 RepID=A0A9N9VBV6_9HYPO|nr:unnamed protein product [Clonostachys rhizophaga]